MEKKIQRDRMLGGGLVAPRESVGRHGRGSSGAAALDAKIGLMPTIKTAGPRDRPYFPIYMVAANDTGRGPRLIANPRRQTEAPHPFLGREVDAPVPAFPGTRSDALLFRSAFG